MRVVLAVEGQELVLKVQEKVGLEHRLALVVVRTGPRLMWSDEATAFSSSIEWTEQSAQAQVECLGAQTDLANVVLDPLLRFGEPVLRGRNVRTDVLGELYRAGETIEGLAEVYELSPELVDEAVRYEFGVARLRPSQPEPDVEARWLRIDTDSGSRSTRARLGWGRR